MELYQVYENNHHDFVRFAVSLTRDREAGQDLVQSAYLKALEQDQLFEWMNSHQIKGWFFTVIKRLFIDDYRRKQTGRRLISKMEADAYQPSFVSDLCTDQALQQLPPPLDKIALLKMEGFTSQEIGNRLGLSASTVRNHLQRIRKELVQEEEI
jgi:RNA polymerase sigma-70 factor (ECF subfamily)